MHKLLEKGVAEVAPVPDEQQAAVARPSRLGTGAIWWAALGVGCSGEPAEEACRGDVEGQDARLQVFIDEAVEPRLEAPPARGPAIRAIS
jgi:hypothetical protein